MKNRLMPVISASRRTDIPAFYSQWFMNRIRSGLCHWLNPFSGQAYRVSLVPEDCLVIVFWTRNPRPLLSHLAELDDRGYKYYFLYTLLDYPRAIESHTPALEAAIEIFQTLSKLVTPNRVFWRYDPIAISNLTPPEWHLERFAYIARRLAGYTHRCIYSFLVEYGKVKRNLSKVSRQKNIEFEAPSTQLRDHLLTEMITISQANEIQLYACCENDDLHIAGLKRSRCVDLEVLQQLTSNPCLSLKSKPSRPLCGCVESVDIGSYDTCLFGCAYCYCYATNNRQIALQRHAAHNPNDTILFRPEKLRAVDLDALIAENASIEVENGTQLSFDLS